MRPTGYILAAAAVLALAACKDEPQKPAGPGTAQGEVLPGSVSDAMLPLDTVRSHAPLAPGSEGGDPEAKPGDKRPAVPAAAADKR